MARKWVKETLHKDILQALVNKCSTWIMNNKENALIGGIILLAIILFIPFIISHQAKMDTEIMTLVSQGELLGAQQQFDQALSYLDQAIGKNRKKTNMLAYYLKGNTLYQMGRYQEAADAYSQFLGQYKNEKLAPEVILGLSKAYEQTAQYDKAISNYNEFINKYPDNAFIPDVFQSLGICYELSGQRDAAIQAYQRIATLYRGSALADMAGSRLAALGISTTTFVNQ